MAKRKKSGRQRRKLFERKAGKSDFLTFYNKVVDKPTPKDVEIGIKFVKRFGVGLSDPNASLPTIRRFWNKATPFYLAISSPKRIDFEAQFLKQHASIESSDKIVSIGAGPAVLEAFIAKKIATKGKVTCIDSSLKFVRIARKIRGKAGLKNMCVLAGSATRLKLSDSSQDKVLMMQTILHGTKHQDKTFKEAFRVIKKTPSARLVLTFVLENKLELKKIQSSLFKNGFSTKISASYLKRLGLKGFIIVASVRASLWK